MKHIQFVDHNCQIESIGDLYCIGSMSRNPNLALSRFSSGLDNPSGLDFYLRSLPNDPNKFLLIKDTVTTVPIQMEINCFLPAGFFTEGSAFAKNYNFAQK